MHKCLTLLLCAACGSLLACEMGQITEPVTADANSTSPDAGPGDVDADLGAPDAAPGAPDATPGAPDANLSAPDAQVFTPDAQPACDDPVTPVGDGFHKAGQPCMPCHENQAYGSLPPFTLSGTLYNGKTSTTGVPGATIHVLDANGDDITLVTTNNGSFWATQQIAFPVKVRASRCPDDMSMPNQVAASGKGCNTCHTAGSRIHLP